MIFCLCQYCNIFMSVEICIYSVLPFILITLRRTNYKMSYFCTIEWLLVASFSSWMLRFNPRTFRVGAAKDREARVQVLSVIWFLLVNHHSTFVSYSSIIRVWYNRPVWSCSSKGLKWKVWSKETTCRVKAQVSGWFWSRF